MASLAPLSWRVEACLGRQAEEAWESGLRRDLAGRLERRLKNARRNLSGLEERARQSARGARLRQDGELLKSAFSRFQRGDSEIQLADFFLDGAPARTVALDPKLTPNENVARLFARAKKLERQAAKLPAEIGLIEERIAALEKFLERSKTEDPETLESEAIANSWLRPRQAKLRPERRKKTVKARKPYLVFHGQSGAEIRVGRSARENDELTFHCARGNDLWLHTANSPGSHVVLRVLKGAEPDPGDVLDAAHLAAHFSPLKKSSKVSVHIARCKEVKKPKKAPHGLVTLSGGKTRLIRIERERLGRLLDTRGNSPA